MGARRLSALALGVLALAGAVALGVVYRAELAALAAAVAGNRYGAGLLTGAATAAVVDFQAFRAWRSFDDAVAYDWKTATWRWFQGAVTGIVTAAGINLAAPS